MYVIYAHSAISLFILNKATPGHFAAVNSKTYEVIKIYQSTLRNHYHSHGSSHNFIRPAGIYKRRS